MAKTSRRKKEAPPAATSTKKKKNANPRDKDNKTNDDVESNVPPQEEYHDHGHHDSDDKNDDRKKPPVNTIVTTKHDNQKKHDQDDEGSIEIGACCLCHCALDYSDRAAFFEEDRQEDYNDNDKSNDEESSYFFRPNDPYVPVELYDKANALVYCDGCDRLYHQKCHFVPLISVPRQRWECLLCQSVHKHAQQSSCKKKNPKTTQTKQQSTTSKSKKTNTPPSSSVARKKSEQKQQQQDKWTKLLEHVDQLFVSPPVPSARPFELQWEYDARHLKAHLWRTELTQRLKQAIQSPASSYRLAETAVLTLTSTQRNRSHFSSSKSQELAQTLCKLYGARTSWRDLCFQLDDLRRATDVHWQQLHQFVASLLDNNKNEGKDHSEFVERVLFPFGTHHPRRVEPRTAEMKQALLLEQPKTGDSVPSEIVVKDSTSAKSKAASSPKRAGKKSTCHQHQHHASKKSNDNDSGISLDDLQCCVCHASTATDENDLVMCDSSGCYRAYHMKCLQPELTAKDIENEDDDWFCPLCRALADTLLAIQVEYLGDEWEQERYQAQIDGQPCDDSHKSWDRPGEVFPTVEQDYFAARQMKQGKRNKATDDLLARVLGLDALPDHDSDDEVLDEDFDQNSFEERRKKTHEDDESSHSSQATLVDMEDCVVLKVGKGELDALSKASSDEDSESEEDANPIRKSRRLAHMPTSRSASRATSRTNSNNNSVSDLGEFDESNILEGKRGRKPVDYIRLNEAIFGDVSEGEAAKLDDADDFEQATSKQKKKDDSDSNDEDDSEDSGSDSDSSSDESSGSGGSNKEEKDDDTSEESVEKKLPAKSKKKVKTPPSTKRKEKGAVNAKSKGAKGQTQKKSQKTANGTKKVAKSNGVSTKGRVATKKRAEPNSKKRKTPSTAASGTAKKRKAKRS